MRKFFPRSAESYSPRAARVLAQPLRSYRYTRRRWRLLFRTLDAMWSRPVQALRNFRTAPAAKEPASILVVQLDHLGDAVLTTGIFPLLKARFPDAQIDVLASRWNREVFANNPHIGRIHVSHRNWFGRARGSRGFLQESLLQGFAMRKYRYDLGIDVRGDFLAAVLLWTARIPRRLGWGAGGGSFLLTDCPTWVPDRAEIESRMALLAPLGIRRSATARPHVFPGMKERRVIAARLQHREHANGRCSPSQRRFVVLHVSAGTEAKRWPLGHLRELVRRLTLRHDVRVILVGEQGDYPLGERVAGGFDRGVVQNWTGRLRILELAALLERSDLFIGADSGPAHLAGWAGVPAIVLFSGSNRVDQWRPPGEQVRVLHHWVTCSPCHRKQCAFAEHPCMTRITPEAVLTLAARILATTSDDLPTAMRHVETPPPRRASASVKSAVAVGGAI